MTFRGRGVFAVREALLLLGETFLDLHDSDQAKRAFQEVTQRYPGSEYAAPAKRHLSELGG